jgi:UPF0755 protein
MKRRRSGGFRFLLLLVLAGAAFYFYRDWSAFSESPLAVSGAQTYELAPGTSFNRMVAQLRERGLTRAPDLYWRALALRMGVATSLRAGEYALDPEVTPHVLLDRMARGQVLHHVFTIVPGWTFRELRQALELEPALKHTIGALSDADVMAALDANGTVPEGRFLPETYDFLKDTTDLTLLKRAYSALQTELAKDWAERSQGLALSNPDEALILASIVEKETGRADERPRIAGVFARRLKLGMRLQTDPTIIYGLGAAYDGNLTRKHLETDGPYNTYTRVGLPPTPIALPGKEALRATLMPAPGDDLYFVARGDGSHQFSSTLAEHEVAVGKFQMHR